MNASTADPTRIRFTPSFIARLELLVGRSTARRGRWEEAGRAMQVGAGDEFVGHRPYRPGDELRDLDWNLLARFDEPFVRVYRRGAGERWTILFDTSASMGLGRPAKLQSAAEIATGLAFSGLGEGAGVRLLAATEEGPRIHGLQRRSELAGWLKFMEGLRATGTAGLRALLAPLGRNAGERVFLVGDLLDVQPAEVAALARPGRSLDLVRVLAPRELEPVGPDGSAPAEVEWLDPETGERLGVALDGDVRRRYENELQTHLERWRETCARHRVAHGVWSSARPFEDVVRGVLFP